MRPSESTFSGRKRKDFAKLFGSVDFRPGWDYKKARRRS